MLLVLYVVWLLLCVSSCFFLSLQRKTKREHTKHLCIWKVIVNLLAQSEIKVPKATLCCMYQQRSRLSQYHVSALVDLKHLNWFATNFEELLRWWSVSDWSARPILGVGTSQKPRLGLSTSSDVPCMPDTRFVYRASNTHRHIRPGAHMSPQLPHGSYKLWPWAHTRSHNCHKVHIIG